MLGLQLPTDPRWVDIVEKNIEEILVDHAYCEQKAASTAISFIIGFPEKTELVQAMIDLVAEEMSHFKMVYDLLIERGFALGRERKDEYVNQLMQEAALAEQSDENAEAQLPREELLKIGTGDTIAGALQDAGVSGAEAYKAVKALTKYYDPRNIKPGQAISVTLEPNEDEGLSSNARSVSHSISSALSPQKPSSSK